MSSKYPQVLLIEDTISLALTYKAFLKPELLEVSSVSTGEEAKAYLDNHKVDLVTLDLGLPDIDGQELLTWITEHHPDTPVIVVTGDDSLETAVSVMKRGAVDFLEKPISSVRLIVTINNALNQKNLSSQVKKIKKTFNKNSFQGFIGKSLPMQAVYKTIESAAPSNAAIFITGESGTGKEVCAEAIHKNSDRAKKPFIAINCGAIPENLIESEIFGHIKGAFTGASMHRDGAATLADGGTLFLDEIGEMAIDLQKKLLRFLQTGTFNKVGSSKLDTVNVRVISATNKDPLAEIERGRFREDLYYRLHVVPIEMPALRERGKDILLIAHHFLEKFSRNENKKFIKFSEEVEQILLNYDWPGNVRQLQNVITNIVVLNNAEEVLRDHLPQPLKNFSLGKKSKKAPLSSFMRMESEDITLEDDDEILSLAQVEKQVITKAIAQCDDNIPKAAAKLGVSPSTIYRKMQNWG